MTSLTQKDLLVFANSLVGDIHAIYPERETPNPHVPTRTAIIALLKEGIDPEDLVRAARNYRTFCERELVAKKYRMGSTRFYRDGIWRRHAARTVHGRTREEWARSGQDVAEFDRLAGQ